MNRSNVEELTMESGPLAKHRVIRLQLLRRLRILDDLIHALPDLLHVPEIRKLHKLRRRVLLGTRVASRSKTVEQRQVQKGPRETVVEIDIRNRAGGGHHKSPVAFLLPARFEALHPFLVRRVVVAHVHSRWCTLEDKQ